jgi:hypothetical protein
MMALIENAVGKILFSALVAFTSITTFIAQKARANSDPEDLIDCSNSPHPRPPCDC